MGAARILHQSKDKESAAAGGEDYSSAGGRASGACGLDVPEAGSIGAEKIDGAVLPADPVASAGSIRLEDVHGAAGSLTDHDLAGLIQGLDRRPSRRRHEDPGQKELP